jgi:AraC family transcriptional regulator
MLQLYTLRSNRIPAPSGGLAGWRIKRVTAFIEANIDVGIRIGDLARIVLLSSSHFCRAFKQTFGETPLRYVMRQRMRRAQAIMLCSRDSLAKIAVDCGMCDQAHFSRVFRRIVGVNPGTWRSRVRASAKFGVPVGPGGAAA